MIDQSFIGYLVAGDGGMQYSLDAALALEKGGVDILEIGIPFTDPIADGPIIQKGHERALKAGTTLEDVLQLIKNIRERSKIPIVLMSYYNPLLSAGDDYLQKAKDAGANAVLVIDLPIEEKKIDIIDQILLVTPSTSEKRLKTIVQNAKGFLYYGIQKGTTGMRDKLPQEIASKLKELKGKSSVPIAAGFGISNREQAREILRYADGFIVGSLFVEAIGRRVYPYELTELARKIDPRGEYV